MHYEFLSPNWRSQQIIQISPICNQPCPMRGHWRWEVVLKRIGQDRKQNMGNPRPLHPDSKNPVSPLAFWTRAQKVLPIEWPLNLLRHPLNSILRSFNSFETPTFDRFSVKKFHFSMTGYIRPDRNHIPHLQDDAIVFLRAIVSSLSNIPIRSENIVSLFAAISWIHGCRSIIHRNSSMKFRAKNHMLQMALQTPQPSSTHAVLIQSNQFSKLALNFWEVTKRTSECFQAK
jgi:hypothetical protein